MKVYLGSKLGVLGVLIYVFIGSSCTVTLYVIATLYNTGLLIGVRNFLESYLL